MRDNTQWEMANESYLFINFFLKTDKNIRMCQVTQMCTCVCGGGAFYVFNGKAGE